MQTKKITVIIFSALFPGMLLANVRRMDLSDAIKSKMVKLSAVNFWGGFTGKAVRLSITNNNKKDSLDLTVNLGIILKPDNPGCQPMVLAGEEDLVVAPNKKEDVEVEIFCGNSPLHCPPMNMHYTYMEVGSKALIMVLRFINDHSLFDYLGQNAVWAITNDHPLSNVYNLSKDTLSKKLIDVICLATGRPHPEYYTVTAQHENPGEAAYTSKTLRVIAQFNVTLGTSTIMTAGVFDDKDHMIEEVFARQMFGKGAHRVDATFDAAAYGAGKYTIRLMDAERTLQEKKVTVEQ